MAFSSAIPVFTNTHSVRYRAIVLISLIPKPTAVRLQNSTRPKEVGLALIIRCLNPSKEYTPNYCKSNEEFQREINMSARMLRQSCELFLNGDFAMWPKVESCAQKEAEDRRMQSKMRVEKAHNKPDIRIQRIRDEAHKAFRSKEYPKSIYLYNSIKNHLTELESKRLKYMEMKIRSG